MAEVLGILNNSPAARAPAATTYKVLYTATASGVLSIHVNNTNITPSGFRIAIVPASAAIPDDGTAPPTYSFVSGGPANAHPIEDAGEYDSPAYPVDIGTQIVIYAVNAGVTFFSGGILF